MFFFLLGGVRQQVTEILQRDVGRCLRCSSPANRVSYDNVLELFFLPIWRWPSQEPALHCNNCGFLLPQHGHADHGSSSASRFHGDLQTPDGDGHHPPPPDNYAARPSDPSICWSCSGTLQSSFKFCPYCGARQGF